MPVHALLEGVRHFARALSVLRLAHLVFEDAAGLLVGALSLILNEHMTFLLNLRRHSLVLGCGRN